MKTLLSFTLVALSAFSLTASAAEMNVDAFSGRTGNAVLLKDGEFAGQGSCQIVTRGNDNKVEIVQNLTAEYKGRMDVSAIAKNATLASETPKKKTYVEKLKSHAFDTECPSWTHSFNNSRTLSVTNAGVVLTTRYTCFLSDYEIKLLCTF